MPRARDRSRRRARRRPRPPSGSKRCAAPAPRPRVGPRASGALANSDSPTMIVGGRPGPPKGLLQESAQCPQQGDHRAFPSRMTHQPDAPPLARELAEAAADLDAEAHRAARRAPWRRRRRPGSHTDVSCGSGRVGRERPEPELGQRVLQQAADVPVAGVRRRRGPSSSTHAQARRAARTASRSARCGDSGGRCRRSRRAAPGRGTTTAAGCVRLRTRSTARGREAHRRQAGRHAEALLRARVARRRCPTRRRRPGCRRAT